MAQLATIPKDKQLYKDHQLQYYEPTYLATFQTLLETDDIVRVFFVFVHLLEVGSFPNSSQMLFTTTRSPIEWMGCYKDTPVYVSSGFDLGVDNCIKKDDQDFKDYGQCDRFDETIGSGWWERHRQSLASRKLFTYSKGLGFSYSAWKMYDDKNPGVIDSPAKLLCLKDVVAAGLLPSLKESSKSAAISCLNGPQADFALGDATLAPSEAPPPDCGNGWWNFTSKKCDYWIPPAPTPMPTDKPTMPCPSCDEKSTVALAGSAAAGAIVALVLNVIGKKMFGGRDGYQTLP